MNWDRQLFPNFQPREFLSPDGMEAYRTRGLILVQFLLVHRIQKLRTHLGKPIFINHDQIGRRRGWRSEAENKAAGGAKYSQHLYGMAADITVPDMPIMELFEVVKGFGFGGIGLAKSRNFIHLDLRNAGYDTQQIIFHY